METNQMPAAGFGTTQGANTTWFNVNKGRYVYRKKEGDKFVDAECDSIWGCLTRFHIEWDEGNEMVRGHYNIVITLTGRGAEGETVSYKVRSFFPSTWGNMFASYLDNIEKGDFIRMNVWSGSENEKVSCMKLTKVDGDGKDIKVERRAYPETPDVSGMEKGKAEEVKAEHQRVKGKISEDIIRGHEAYEEPAPDSSNAATGTTAPGTATSEPAPNPPMEYYDDSETPSNIVAIVAENAKYEAFGHSVGPKMKPTAQDFASALTQGMQESTHLYKLASAIGIGDGADVWLALRAILRAMGFTPDHLTGYGAITMGDWKLGQTIFTKILLGKGTKETPILDTAAQRDLLKAITIERTKVDKKPAASTAPAADEYDPFADE